MLQYTIVIINTGGAYNPTDCVFVAPEDGYYVFSWSSSNVDLHYTDFALMRNGAEILVESAYAGNIKYSVDSTSQTVTTQLVSGDRIWVKLKGGHNPYVEGPRFDGVFTGFKL